MHRFESLKQCQGHLSWTQNNTIPHIRTPKYRARYFTNIRVSTIPASIPPTVPRLTLKPLLKDEIAGLEAGPQFYPFGVSEIVPHTGVIDSLNSNLWLAKKTVSKLTLTERARIWKRGPLHGCPPRSLLPTDTERGLSTSVSRKLQMWSPFWGSIPNILAEKWQQSPKRTTDIP